MGKDTKQSSSSSSGSKDNSGSNKSNKSSTASKPTSAASTKSNTSQSSVASIGIGTAPPNPKPPSADAPLRFRLMPEGSGTNVMNIYEHHVFDCVVFFIYCKPHGKIALTNTDERNRMFSWFPFIPLREVFTWSRVSRDGLAIILGKSDSAGEMDPTMAVLPDFSMDPLSIFRLYMPSSNKFYIRITQFVTLHEPSNKDVEVRCCVDTARIRWLKLIDVAERLQLTNLWGHEVVSLGRSLLREERTFLSEFNFDAIHEYEADADTLKLIRTVGWSQNQVHEVYQDFVQHMYPAFHMTRNSFRCFVVKLTLLERSDKRIERLFKTFAAGSEFVSFYQMLIGLACMHRKVPNEMEARVQFIFRYYDHDCTNELSAVEINEFLTDLEIKEKSSREGSSKPSSKIPKFFATDKLKVEAFGKILRSKEGSAINTACDKLLRLEKPYFEAKKRSHKAASNKSTDTSSSQGHKAKSNKGDAPKLEDGFLCPYHCAHKYDYGLHTVTLDSTGRCVDPRMIEESWISNWAKDEMSRQRFSMENVFRVDSIANIFLDLIRDFNEKERDKTHNRGLLTAHEEDWETLAEYVEILCEQVLSVVRCEPKLLRLASPLYIVGDLLGSLADLFLYESHILRSAPVSPNTILLLGNYSGAASRYGIECILFLFALKVVMPNNIYLLRGREELREFNRRSLHIELVNKYGRKYGDKIYELINSVFDCLPLGAIIEETILCTHSGIPRMDKDKRLLAAFAEDPILKQGPEVRNPKDTFPIGYDMIVNVPSRYQGDALGEQQSGSSTNASGRPLFTPSPTNKYYFFNKEAFRAFMRVNDFDYLIRSHNPCAEAYALCFSNKVLTVFSTRKHTHTELSGTAIVQISDASHKIRFLRFGYTSDKSQKESISKSK